MRDVRGSDIIVTGWEMDPVRLAIVDSGCSSDTHPIDLALRKFPKKIRNLIKPIQFDTAADPIICDKGATVKYGVWDFPLDVCLSPGSPSLISVGQRVIEAGMSFFWTAGRQPCMIIADLEVYRHLRDFDHRSCVCSLFRKVKEFVPRNIHTCR